MSNSIGVGDRLTMDSYEDDENDMTSVEGSTDNPIPGSADISIADTISEATDDGKPRERSNTVTASHRNTSSLLVTPTEPLPSTQPPDPETPKADKEFVDTQERHMTAGERRWSVDEPQSSPERTPAPAVIPLPNDA